MRRIALLPQKPLVALIALFYSLCFLALFAWHTANRFSVTGDEPHYLIMADGIVRHGTLEQTRPYSDEFQTSAIYAPGLADPQAKPSAENTHAVQGPRGLFNAHNIGLPLLIALPFAIAGTSGVKIFLILLAGLAPFCIWTFAQTFTKQRNIALLTAIAVTCGLPLIPAANQIYPDLLGGVCALAAITSLFFQKNFKRDGYRWSNGLGLFAVAFLPWLHLKFAIAGGLLTGGFCYARFRQTRSWVRASLMFLPLICSVGILSLYNFYAFGDPTGPYTEGALVLSLKSATVLFGLYFDQFQGMLLQNPSFLLGLLFIPLFLRRNPLVGSLLIVTHLAFVVPNAMHPNWYGGYSFAGRFGWSGALLIMPFAVFGIIEIAKDLGHRAKWLPWILIALQAILYWRYSFERFSLYNVKSVFPQEYPTFWPLLKTQMPMLYDSSWAYSYWPNFIWGLGGLGIILLGIAGAFRINRRLFYRSLLGLSGLGLVSLAFATVTSSSAYPESSVVYNVYNLGSEVGTLEQHKLVAEAGKAQPGFLSYGPSVKLWEDRYSAVIDYEASDDSQSLANWDVFASSEGEIIATGALPPAQGLSSVEIEFNVPPHLADSRFEIRVFWLGQGRLSVNSLTLKPVETLGESPVQNSEQESLPPLAPAVGQ